MSEHTGTLRVTIREAAARLGVTEGAVRKRIQRGSLPKEQGEDGRVYVYLPVAYDSSREESRTQPMSSPDPRDELIVQLRSEVEAWREESRRKDTIIMNITEAMKAISPPEPRLGQEEEPPPPASAEALPGTREYAVTPTEQPGRVGPQTPLREAPQSTWERLREGPPERADTRPSGREAQEGTERRSLWQRLFGG
jgi:hypothetical protein